MKVSDLKKFYGVSSNIELSKKIKRTRVTIWKWQKQGIPVRTQAVFEVESQGRLKAELSRAS
ncbi:hypothetical protein [Acinetobacter pseudolwoffii]|uniref:Cro/Cl family transcriptional regulator n=1 Tax=Acinetobacter pseudolwoffii TaxID=2053287 RepID=A0A2H9YS98_9GAMM|nr:hypothetical protein [Acinetobacter pseudolwoffii]PJO75474.1 hypothetical protein CWI32_08045 [Acinetobacter pseudolwoffii]